jgi:hypothetical protein
VGLAFSGHKQPQQSMAVNYVLALGGEFDLLINLDGFNEIALADGNVRGQCSPFYPRDWDERLHDAPARAHLADHEQLWQVRGRRQQAARAMQASWLRWSALRSLIWKWQDILFAREETRLAAQTHTHTVAERWSFRRVGPPVSFTNDDEKYARFAEVWANSSRELHHLATGEGFRYVHALQPNQYDPLSKPLSESETQLAYNHDSDYRRSVEAGYPRLRDAGRRLREQGVPFHDLSGLFSDVAETLYCDDCCHFNRRGNELLAQAIAAAILAGNE